MMTKEDFYSLTVLDIYGRKVKLDTFRERVCIIVNLESLDGLATQTLLRLKHFKEEDFNNVFDILVFPIADYLRSEQTRRIVLKDFFKPYTPELHLFDCISISKGHPLFEYLYSCNKGWKGNELRYNFTKFVVYRGEVIHTYKPNEIPLHSDKELKMFHQKKKVEINNQPESEPENDFY
ncbi:hypothetical protein H311_00442 [Anncaliia algerae PRA109]|nr:hypothetical protein H311_00442 [Anncaliia algerae PRA109]